MTNPKLPIIGTMFAEGRPQRPSAQAVATLVRTMTGSHDISDHRCLMLLQGGTGFTEMHPVPNTDVDPYIVTYRINLETMQNWVDQAEPARGFYDFWSDLRFGRFPRFGCDLLARHFATLDRIMRDPIEVCLDGIPGDWETTSIICIGDAYMLNSFLMFCAWHGRYLFQSQGLRSSGYLMSDVVYWNQTGRRADTRSASLESNEIGFTPRDA